MTMTRQAVASQAGMLQNLGNQIRQDVTTLMARRQMQGLAEGLQSVDTTSPQFGRQVAGLFAQYPLAAQSPLGQAAINQLGSEFKLNQQIAADDRRFRNQLGMLNANDYMKNRAPIGRDVTMGDLERAAGRRPSLPTNGVGAGLNQPGITSGDGNPLFDVNDNVGPQEAPIDPANPNVSIVQPPAAQAAAPNAGSGIVQELDAFMNDMMRRGVPRMEADRRLRLKEIELRNRGRASSTRVENTEQHGLMERGPDGVWHPAKTADGAPLGSRASGGARSSGDRGSLVQLRKELTEKYAELEAKAKGEGQAFLTASKQGAPEQDRQRQHIIAMKARAQAEAMKAQLDQVEARLKEMDAASAQGGAASTQPARPRIRYTNGQVIVE